MKLPLELLLPADPERGDKDQVNRIKAYAAWVADNAVTLADLRLGHYRAYLLGERSLSRSTVRVHLSTIRASFNRLLDKDNPALPKYLADQGATETEREVLLGQIAQALYDRSTKVKVRPQTPRNKRLATEDINGLLASLEVRTLMGLRDTAVITLMVTTGIREQELCGLDVDDLQQNFEGNPALRLRLESEQDTKERFVPYGEYDWVITIVKTWLRVTGITEGAVFRGFYKSGQLLRPNRLSPRAVENLLAAHPILLNGEPVVLKPLDLRHAYARNRYQQGLDMETLAQYLGLKSIQTVDGYIRQPRYEPFNAAADEFEFDLRQLAEAGTEKGGGR